MTWQLYRYALPFSPPFNQREGCLLKVHFPDGRIGWGEIAPLPGRSRETRAQAEEQLLAYLRGEENSFPLFPSVRFGLEHATSPKSFCDTQFPLCALLWGTPQAILKKAQEVYAQGYRTIKVKISQLSLIEARALLTDLIPLFQIRIDLNRALSFAEAVTFFSLFDPRAFAFIEEPTYEVDKLQHFPFPFALDESLQELPKEVLRTLPHLRALVIKPSLVGGKEECLRWKEIAEELTLDLVWSSACESGLGIAQICRLSQECGAVSLPLGLDTYRFLQEDLLEQALDFSQPFLQIPDPLSMNSTKLQEVAHG